jgi:hypothetical protein
MQDIVIFGSGGLAREVAFLIEQINNAAPQWNILGFIEPDRERVGQEIGKYRVYCTDEELVDKTVAAAIGVGKPAVIHKIQDRDTLRRTRKRQFSEPDSPERHTRRAASQAGPREYSLCGEYLHH